MTAYKDQIQGRIKVVQGKIKETAGKLVGNKELQAKGKAQKTRGQAQAKFGDVKQKLKTTKKKATKKERPRRKSNGSDVGRSFSVVSVAAHVRNVTDRLRSCAPVSLRWHKECLRAIWQKSLTEGEAVGAGGVGLAAGSRSSERRAASRRRSASGTSS